MVRPYLPSLFDELTKISEDLMTPAVTAESNIQDSTPAAPWTRRRGYRRLANPLARERPDINKQAGVLSAFTSKYQQARLQAAKAKKLVGDAALKTYVKMPHPVQKALTSQTMLDSSDPTSAIAGRSLMRIIGGG